MLSSARQASPAAAPPYPVADEAAVLGGLRRPAMDDAIPAAARLGREGEAPADDGAEFVGHPSLAGFNEANAFGKSVSVLSSSARRRAARDGLRIERKGRKIQCPNFRGGNILIFLMMG